MRILFLRRAFTALDDGPDMPALAELLGGAPEVEQLKLAHMVAERPDDWGAILGADVLSIDDVKRYGPNVLLFDSGIHGRGLDNRLRWRMPEDLFREIVDAGAVALVVGLSAPLLWGTNGSELGPWYAESVKVLGAAVRYIDHDWTRPIRLVDDVRTHSPSPWTSIILEPEQMQIDEQARQIFEGIDAVYAGGPVELVLTGPGQVLATTNKDSSRAITKEDESPSLVAQSFAVAARRGLGHVVTVAADVTSSDALKFEGNSQWILNILRTKIESAAQLRRLRGIGFTPSVGPNATVPTYELITRSIAGEDDTVEFKSSFAVATGTTDPGASELKYKVARAVVSLMNSDGGTVLVGIDDNGSVRGLSADLARYREDLEKLVKAVNNYLRDPKQLGPQATSHLTLNPEGHDQQLIIRIDAPRSPSGPIYMRAKDGDKWKSLIVRVNNESVSLARDEQDAWIRERWPTY